MKEALILSSKKSSLVRPLAVLIASMLLYVGCSTTLVHQNKAQDMIDNGQYEKVLLEITEDNYGSLNELLYNLDMGIVSHYAGEYAKSISFLQVAEAIADEQYATSISGEIASTFLNDNILPYKAEDFEIVLINLFICLNYIQLNNLEAALVEARKVNEKLVYFNSNYEEDQQNVYNEDAFARLLAGALYQSSNSRNDLNDAFIAYQNAYNRYQQGNYGTKAPSFLKNNLLTMASFMGNEELERYSSEFPDTELIPWRESSQLAHLYVIQYSGKSPRKETEHLVIGPDIPLTVPDYQDRNYQIKSSLARLIKGNGQIKQLMLEPVDNIGAIAKQNLNDRRLRIIAKRLIGRIAQEQLPSEFNLILNLISAQADLRSWLLLPDQILMGQSLIKITPPYDRYSIEFDLLDAYGNVIETVKQEPFSLREGQTKFVFLHTSQ